MSLRSPNDKKFMGHTDDDTIKVASLNDKILDFKLILWEKWFSKIHLP